MNGCHTSPPQGAKGVDGRCPFRLCAAGGRAIGDDAPRLPGAAGTDLLLKRWSARTGRYELFGALRQALVRHAGAGHVLVCRPRSGLWLHATEAPEEGDLVFIGTCEALRPGQTGSFRRMQSGADVCRWSLGIPELGRVEAQFAAQAGPLELPTGRLPRFRLAFSLNGRLTFRPD